MNSYSNSIDAICAAYDSLSDTEKRVADFIIQNSDDVAKFSVREIATQSKTSSATVSRFVRHIGYESFSELRLAIATDQSNSNSSDDDGVTEISLDNIEASINYILDNKIQELTGTAEQLNSSRVKKVIDLIVESDEILFAAVGNSIPVCSSLAFKLGQIGLRANCPTTTESMILASLSLRRDDLLFVVSSSGYSHRLETIVDNAEDSGTPIIFVTTNPASMLAKRADVVLTAVTRDQLLTGPQFSTHVAEDFIVETLFMFILASRKYAREHARMEQKSLGRDKETTPTFS
ncbi:MAG: MurR/RpiR family transcriptional regulator [Olegusella sp.]|nr:MurR/RpiR family transcriptional regulator [Olegusella sp.]